MVDTSLVGRLVEQAIADPDRLHVLISGDLDMLPAIRTVVPDYTETVVLATTHPDQYIRGRPSLHSVSISSTFAFEPIYLDQSVDQFVSGDHVYRCSNPRCNSISRDLALFPVAANPVCKPCNDDRAAAAAAR